MRRKRCVRRGKREAGKGKERAGIARRDTHGGSRDAVASEAERREGGKGVARCWEERATQERQEQTSVPASSEGGRTRKARER